MIGTTSQSSTTSHQTFDFDTVINRRGTNSYKWDTPQDPEVIAMWVADMDFRTAPCIIEALEKRVQHGIFGYTKVPKEYYQATVDWFLDNHGWEINPDDIIYTSGVVPAISAIIKGLTSPGDKVMVMTPAYNCFFSSIRNNKCELVSNELVHDEKGYYTIDFEKFERQASEARMLVLCNPHNPVSRVWTRQELTRIAQICKKNDVKVVSDEIHNELTYTPYKYIPFATIAKEVGIDSIVCCSPSKSFNIAGLQIANIIATNKEHLLKIDRAINDNEVCDVNPFGVVALIAAYRQGKPWLEALKKYLYQNYLVLKEYFSENLPQYVITPLEATYLPWIDVRPSKMTGDQVTEKLLEKEKLMVCSGSIYGKGGEDFIRLNIACPRSVLEKILPRLKSVLKIDGIESRIDLD